MFNELGWLPQMNRCMFFLIMYWNTFLPSLSGFERVDWVKPEP